MFTPFISCEQRRVGVVVVAAGAGGEGGREKCVALQGVWALLSEVEI